MRKSSVPIASLSLDLDNQWSYMKINGDPRWQSLPSYLDVVVPRILKFLEERALKITFFIVGQDAALEKNQDIMQAIAQAGHEIGNHSFAHDSWLHLYSQEEITREIANAQAQIERVTGQRPLGFRSPGYSFSPLLLQVLIECGYQYDASTFPTFLGPIARFYYLMTTKLSSEEKEKRQALFGRFQDGFQSLKPYEWLSGEGKIIEIPVTTMPIFKTPIHFTYILYLSTFSPIIGLLYFRFALWLCKLMSIQPSLLLHPTDFLDVQEVPELAFFPAMSINSDQKMEILHKALQILSDNFMVTNLGLHAQSIGDQNLNSWRV